MVKNYNQVLRQNETIDLEKIVLRKYVTEDANDLLEFTSDEKVLEYVGWRQEGNKTIEDALSSIHDYLLSRPGIWAIELKSNKKCIGTIDLRILEDNDKADFGYMLHRDFWGQGIMTSALSAVIDLAFAKLDLNRVEANYYIGNEGSGRVMEKCGMIKEGLRLKGVKIKDKYFDIVLYGILKENYEK